MRLLSSGRGRRARTSTRDLLDRSGLGGGGFLPLEHLEKREVLALTGVTATQFPRIAYDVTGVTTYDAASQAFDVLATPTSIRFSASTPPVTIQPLTLPDGHGDVAIHARVDSTGALLGGVSGDDFVLQGLVDTNGNGVQDPGELSGALLTGEIYAFGFLDSGLSTDSYDFRFVPTGGLLLASWPAGQDIGITMTSEHSTFDGTFTQDFTGGAKGTIAPLAPPALSSIAGNVYCDVDFSNSLSAGDFGHGAVSMFLTGTNDAGQSISLSTSTAADGTYSFPALRPGTYTITQTDPPHTLDGATTFGTAGGTVVDSDTIAAISLGAGVNATDYNFGHICLGSISGTKFLDATGDGLTGDDAPLGGATIYLDANNNGMLDSGEASTTTAPDGTYSFQDVYPGNYVIREVVPGNTYQTAPSAGFYTVSVGQDQAATGNDFDNALFGSISGVKYNDRTANGITPDDSFLAGVTVFIDANGNGALDSGEVSTTTGPDGSYSFTGLRAGTYVVREVVPAGFQRTAPAPTDSYAAPVIPGQNTGGNDFANTQLVSIYGTKYNDKTCNGITSDDTALGGVTIYIDANNNGSLDSGETSTTTAPNGTYSFTGLLPGTYIIREVLASGWVRTAPTSGFYSVTLTSGQSATGRDFANTQLGSISGTKYRDTTGNGITSDDTALGGVTLYIDANNNGSLDSGERSTTTAPNGTYSFTGLAPGTYIVREVVQSGWMRTFPSPSDNYSVTIVSGTFATGKNFANAQLGSISGKKFLDMSGNGLTSDDGGFGGVTIYIDANNNGAKDPNERSTVTASDGSFSFTSLAAGTYIVREVVPAGYVRTAPVLADNYSVTLTTGQAANGINFANAEMCDMDMVTNIEYSINNCSVVSDLRGQTHQGDVVTVTFTVAAGVQPHQFTLVSYTAPGPTWDPNTASQQQIFDQATGAFGPGTYSLTVNIPDCYYQIDFVCGKAIDRLGPAGSNITYSAQTRLFSADNGGVNACVANAASISGKVWLDDDNDGVVDASELPIAGAKVTLTWTQSGVNKSIVRTTGPDGTYLISNLTPGLVYKITETQPTGYADGKDVKGTAGGTLGNDYVSGITLGANVAAANYNFGERSSNDTCGSHEAAAISFWCSTAGQNLIKSLNGGSISLNLGAFLGNTFPHLFGDLAGSFNLKGKTNAQVASAIVSRNGSSSTNLEAQTFALALSGYATNSGLAGGTMASSYGFTVNNAGSGLSYTSVGSSGTLLGLANSSSQRILSILLALDSRATSHNGMIYSGVSASRTTLYNFIRTVNGLGGIN